jgi:hypothetical protein
MKKTQKSNSEPQIKKSNNTETSPITFDPIFATSLETSQPLHSCVTKEMLKKTCRARAEMLTSEPKIGYSTNFL